MAISSLSGGGSSLNSRAANNGQGIIKTVSKELPAPTATTRTSLNDIAKANGQGLIKTVAQQFPAKTTTNTGSGSGSKTVTTTATAEMPSYSYSGGSTDDIVGRIKSLLDEQKKAADEYYKNMYEQQLSQNKQAFENNRNQINANYMRGNRYLQNMYGDNVSGTGLSNRTRNYQNWQSNLASNRLNYTNNDATALSAYNSGLANNASTLAQGWYNYVLPVYSNRQQNEDDYNYRKYLASL